MPSVILNRKEVEKSIGKILSLEELKDRISMLGTDLEEINDDEIIVEIFPNRPDLLSEQGFSRALASFIGAKKGLRKYSVKKSGEKVIVDSSVSKVRPYTACCIVKNLKLDDNKIKEIINIQEKLHVTYGRNRKKAAIGIYPLDKIKMPIKFLAKKPREIKFKPLGAEKEMYGNEILEKHPTGKEYGYLLKEEKLFPLFVDNDNKVLSMPPIINSDDVGRVDEGTKNVFIECSGFNYDVLAKCLNIIVAALYDMGGEIYSMQIEYGSNKILSPNLDADKMNVELDYVNKMLGIKLSLEELKDYLSNMGLGYDGGNVLIPCYRADILHPIDIVEDVAIAYGYENFKEEIPNVATIGKESEIAKFKDKLAEVLIGLQFLETNSYNLVAEKELENMEVKKEKVVIENPVNVEYNVLRNSMLPSLLKILSENKHNEFPQNLFEMGKIFVKDEEVNSLGIVLCHDKANFTEAKQVLDVIFSSIGLDYDIKEVKHDSFIEGRVAKITVNDKDIAYIGEINPKVLENFELIMPVAAIEIDVDELKKLI